MYGKIFCIVLNWNGKRFLKGCLDSVLSSDYEDLHVVVVDNASTDGSAQFIKTNYKKVKLIKNKSNLGWTGGNNKGVEFALKNKADAVFVLNNDTKIDKKCISILAKELFRNKTNGIVGPKIYLTSSKGTKTKKISFAGGKFTKNRYFGVHIGNNKIDEGQYNTIRSSEFITGAAMMVRSQVFNEIGKFDDSFFIYYDEADFCMRAKKAGFKIHIIPKAHVYHAFSGTVELNSPFQKYYTTRNHFLFVEKNAPVEVKVREFLRTPKTILEFFRGNPNDKYSLLGLRDYYLRKFGKRIYWL